ncbi:putative lipoprotein [Sulfitobacter noctilucae]|nr:putative lipoprotein [Sulfitobacter noctilucae]
MIAVCVGCNMPSPAFRGAAATRVKVEGSTFDVRIKGLRAEAIRINPEYAPRFGPIRYRAALAMQLVSGCDVLSVSGDQAQAFGRLKCGTKAARRVRRPRELDCVPVRGSGIPEIGQLRVELDCDPA